MALLRSQVKNISYSPPAPGIPAGEQSIVDGTSTGNMLYWDGTDWTETTDLDLTPGSDLTITGSAALKIHLDPTGGERSTISASEVFGTTFLTLGFSGGTSVVQIAETGAIVIGDTTGAAGSIILGCGSTDRIDIRADTSNELRIVWDGTNWLLDNQENSSHLIFQGSASTSANRTLIICDPDGPVQLFYDGTLEAETKSSGFRVDDELEIDGDLAHQGTNVGFYNVTPVARPTAYTQTFATADDTHAARTALTMTDSTGSTPDNTVVALSVVGGSGASTAQEGEINDNFSDVTDEINKLIVDLADTAELLNSVIDDLQANGILQ